MYVNNVRNAIRNLGAVEKIKYLNRLRQILKERYNKNVKPSELKEHVEEFVNGRNPKIAYFEAYLLTFDELFQDGSMCVLHNRLIRTPEAWEQLMISIANDKDISRDIVKHFDDKQASPYLKVLFYGILEHCKDENTEQFLKNLYVFNEFLKIRR